MGLPVILACTAKTAFAHHPEVERYSSAIGYGRTPLVPLVSDASHHSTIANHGYALRGIKIDGVG